MLERRSKLLQYNDRNEAELAFDLVSDCDGRQNDVQESPKGKPIQSYQKIIRKMWNKKQRFALMMKITLYDDPVFD